MRYIVLKRQNGKLILKPFQGEVGEPGQKGSKADKGEQVSKFNSKILIYTHLHSESVLLQIQWLNDFHDIVFFKVLPMIK